MWDRLSFGRELSALVPAGQFVHVPVQMWERVGVSVCKCVSGEWWWGNP